MRSIPTFSGLDAALAGFGLAYVPEDVAQPHLAQGRLKRVLEDWCPPYSGHHLYYPSRRRSTQPSPYWSRRFVTVDLGQLRTADPKRV